MSTTQSAQTSRPRAKSPKKGKHRLTVFYDGNQIADLDVDQFRFHVTENGIRIEAGDAVSQGMSVQNVNGVNSGVNSAEQSEKAKLAISQLVNALKARQQQPVLDSPTP